MYSEAREQRSPMAFTHHMNLMNQAHPSDHKKWKQFKRRQKKHSVSNEHLALSI
jgi:hypothetical protein